MIRSEYIKRLKERLREKPDSRIFLSLAEELKKDDKLNEAMDVLINGLRKVPDFNAARLTLGRWYLESNMPSEAKKEFSEVLGHSPNNIFAIKWLNKINPPLLKGGRRVASALKDAGADSQSNTQLLEAEKLIETGRYQTAMEIYNAILKSILKELPEYRPEYRIALQKREELISLMNITGIRVPCRIQPPLSPFIKGEYGGRTVGKEQVLHKLNIFLNAIRDRFTEKPAVRNKNSAINRLNKFLEAVKTRFAASPI